MGRPAGSTDGRTPIGGYPDLEPDFGDFLAGFLEGEACFLITRQPRRANHRCAVSVGVRDDDQILLSEFAKATRLGTVLPVSARGSSKPQGLWTVNSKADCVRLTEILYRHPLRGRKSGDFALWAAAVDWWAGPDPTRRRINRDWTPMVYIKRRLHESRMYNPRPDRIRDQTPGLSRDWIAFMSGLLTADGSLGIHRNGGGLLPVARIALRADDAPLLHQLRARTEIGRVLVNERVHRGKRSREASWTIRGTGDLVRLVSILSSCPPKGRRRAEFGIWHKAVAVYSRERGRSAELAKLRASLAAARAYPVC